MNLIWFRKDLRLQDNPALCAALTAGDVRAIYIANPKQWQQHHGSAIQADFIERHLNLVAKQLADIGIELEILECPYFKNVTELLKEYCQRLHVQRIFANTELEFNEQRRDQQIVESGVPLVLLEADVIQPKGSVINLQGEMFKVFTPFKKAWISRLKSHWFECAPLNKSHQRKISPPAPISVPYGKKDSSKWPLINEHLNSKFENFLHNKVQHYDKNRDFPGIKGTSGLSPYLAIGAVSPKVILKQLLEVYPQLPDSPNHPVFSWLNELIWREFYRHLMYHFPKLSRDHNFKPQYDELPWVNDELNFKLWCEGKTGYPIVDAAMRQLHDIGWMHNRLRMIVASFLTKHLLIDWRLGQNFFSEHLIDNDLAANNGGWQWSAGTGCDAQPYFRIFNPISQSQKFDPQGTFIRHYLPELKLLDDKDIHFPHEQLNYSLFSQSRYWPPIVNHAQARAQALDFYKLNTRKIA